MLKSLHAGLTAWYVGLTMILYALGSMCAMVVFASGLTSSLIEGLKESLVEIRPSIEFSDGHPTLVRWAQAARTAKLNLSSSVQIFDLQHRILEEYGPQGIPELAAGHISSGSGPNAQSLSSRYEAVDEHGVPRGFLQVQVSTKHRDEAVRHFGFTLLVIAPFLAVGVGVAGYLFAGKAVKPTEESLDLLRRFVADAGHEFNTPITIIEASLQTLRELLSEKSVEREVVDIIERASERMKNLSANLILLAKMETPQAAFPKVPIALREVIEPLVEEFEELARSKEITLAFEPVPPLTVVGHANSLRRMFSNLLNNAIRYTEPGGTVRLAARAQDSEVIVSVEDTGIGIPPESMPRIFDRFYRVDKSRSRSAGGSGLGLSIVKAVVDSHQGTIKAESKVGQGSKFTVILPGRA